MRRGSASWRYSILCFIDRFAILILFLDGGFVSRLLRLRRPVDGLV
jgi:hypothetical protein